MVLTEVVVRLSEFARVTAAAEKNVGEDPPELKMKAPRGVSELQGLETVSGTCRGERWTLSWSQRGRRRLMAAWRRRAGAEVQRKERYRGSLVERKLGGRLAEGGDGV